MRLAKISPPVLARLRRAIIVGLAYCVVPAPAVADPAGQDAAGHAHALANVGAPACRDIRSLPLLRRRRRQRADAFASACPAPSRASTVSMSNSCARRSSCRRRLRKSHGSIPGRAENLLRTRRAVVDIDDAREAATFHLDRARAFRMALR